MKRAYRLRYRLRFGDIWGRPVFKLYATDLDLLADFVDDFWLGTVYSAEEGLWDLLRKRLEP